MTGQHWFTILAALLVGYVLARYFPAPGQAVGLP
jgi:hypothetical protein